MSGRSWSIVEICSGQRLWLLKGRLGSRSVIITTPGPPRTRAGRKREEEREPGDLTQPQSHGRAPALPLLGVTCLVLSWLAAVMNEVGNLPARHLLIVRLQSSWGCWRCSVLYCTVLYWLAGLPLLWLETEKSQRFHAFQSLHRGSTQATTD